MDSFHGNSHKPCIYLFSKGGPIQIRNWSILPHPQVNNPRIGPRVRLGRGSIDYVAKNSISAQKRRVLTTL